MNNIKCSEEEKSFNNKIPLISFILSIMVIFIHANNNKQYSNSGVVYWCEFFISEDLCRMAVPLFFAISGFLFYKNYGFDRIIYKYKTRFFSLILPYFIWNFIWMIAFYFMSKLSIVNSVPFSLTIENVFYGLFLYRYCPVFWFMFQLILFVLFNPAIYIVIKNKYVGAISLVGLYIIYGFGVKEIFNIVKIDSLIYYMIGSYVAIHFKTKIYYSSNGRGIMSFVMLIVSQIIFVINYKLNIPVLDLLLLTIGMIGLFGVLCLIISSKIKDNWFMQSTFMIYAMHGLILETIKKLVFIFFPHTSVVAIISYFLLPLITILIIYVFVKTISKYLPKLYLFLSGGRAIPLIKK